MFMKRLQDGQLDGCDMTFRELATVEASMTKTLTAHYHGRIAYPDQPNEDKSEPQQQDETEQPEQNEQEQETSQ